ncbi:MAG: hypothetical protein ACRD2T_12040 [Thermoanaerobaculia bacterium]
MPTVLSLVAGLGLALGGDLADVVAPVSGAKLVAGETAWIEWLPAPELARFAKAEEWEAFISFDGGESFPVRLTPHLDLGHRRVAFRVPPVISPDCRLLLRFGDEREEREQPVPGHFEIVPASAPRFVARRRVLARGEAARPGDPGVVLWAEGARDGSGWREVEAWDPAPTCAPLYRPIQLFALAALAPEGHRSPPARDDARACRPPRPTGPLRAPPGPCPAAASLLLLLHRLNR